MPVRVLKWKNTIMIIVCKPRTKNSYTSVYEKQNLKRVHRACVEEITIHMDTNSNGTTEPN